MTQTIKTDTWVFVVIQDPGKDEQFLGQLDETNNISFIPFFLEKEAASQCLLHLPKEISKKYEVQAIIYEDLLQYAVNNEFLLYQLNDSGEIIEIYPSQRS